MLGKLSHVGFGLVIVASMLAADQAQGQTFRQEGRLRARANRRAGRAEARTFGNTGTPYYSGYGGNNYGPGYGGAGNYAPGYYAGGYGPAYNSGVGGYGPGFAGPGYGGSRYSPAYANGPGYYNSAADAPTAYTPPPSVRQRAYLGITMSETPDGVVRISGVRTNSPAAEAGLRVGDVLLALNGREIYSAQDVSRMVARHVPGDAVALDIDRNGRNDRVEALLTGQTGQFVAGARAGSGFVPDYAEPAVNQGRPLAPMEARRAERPEEIGPGVYQPY